MSLKTKTFDCVEMKREAQAKLAEQYSGLSDRERFALAEQELMTAEDPVSRWWQRAVKKSADSKSTF